MESEAVSKPHSVPHNLGNIAILPWEIRQMVWSNLFKESSNLACFRVNRGWYNEICAAFFKASMIVCPLSELAIDPCAGFLEAELFAPTRSADCYLSEYSETCEVLPGDEGIDSHEVPLYLFGTIVFTMDSSICKLGCSEPKRLLRNISTCLLERQNFLQVTSGPQRILFKFKTLDMPKNPLDVMIPPRYYSTALFKAWEASSNTCETIIATVSVLLGAQDLWQVRCMEDNWLGPSSSDHTLAPSDLSAYTRKSPGELQVLDNQTRILENIDTGYRYDWKDDQYYDRYDCDQDMCDMDAILGCGIPSEHDIFISALKRRWIEYRRYSGHFLGMSKFPCLSRKMPDGQVSHVDFWPSEEEEEEAERRVGYEDGRFYWRSPKQLREYDLQHS